MEKFIQRKKAFTLVELIIVIVILAILGTIAFISLQGYSTQARDSARVSDLSRMKTSLELFQLDSGKYPMPTNGENVLYSGAVVWTQGTFGETVFSNVDKLDKDPMDPLTDSFYTYSVTQNRGKFQLGGILEGDQIVNSEQGIVNSALAAGTVDAVAFVTGTYNGQITKSLSGSSLCNILAVPSIITNDISITDLETINNENRFVYRGQKNLPSSFKTTKFNNEGGFLFKVNKLVAYLDSSNACKNLTNKTNPIERLVMLKGIQDAYTGTILKDDGEIKNILLLDINLSNPSTEVKNYAGLFVNNNLGGDIPVEGLAGGNSSLGGNCDLSQPNNTSVLVEGTPLSIDKAWQSLNPNEACYFSCNSGYGSTGTGCVLANACDNTLEEITLANGQVWACKNLGATTVRDGFSATTDCGFVDTVNCNAGKTWIGDYYQWGRNEPVNTTTTLLAYSGSFTGLLGHNDFVKGQVTNNDWWINESGSGPQSRWSGVNEQGPCPVGWHIPTITEWESACDIISGTNCADNTTTVNIFKNTLKLPYVGWREPLQGKYSANSTYAYYWSTTPSGSSSWGFFFKSDMIHSLYTFGRAGGIVVRCLKN